EWWCPRHGDDGVVLRWMEPSSASNNGGPGLRLRRRWAASPGWEARHGGVVGGWETRRRRTNQHGERNGAAVRRAQGAMLGEDNGGCDQRAKVQG
ncbi:hypothetical protein U1Q18_013107, partial [Sarracenia purpurea var. burkii]